MSLWTHTTSAKRIRQRFTESRGVHAGTPVSPTANIDKSGLGLTHNWDCLLADPCTVAVVCDQT